MSPLPTPPTTPLSRRPWLRIPNSPPWPRVNEYTIQHCWSIHSECVHQVVPCSQPPPSRQSPLLGLCVRARSLAVNSVNCLEARTAASLISTTSPRECPFFSRPSINGVFFALTVGGGGVQTRTVGHHAAALCMVCTLAWQVD